MFEATNFNYNYAPILKLQPSEITALQELTDRAKDLVLPVILLRGWVGSKKLENSIPRIQKAFGNRNFILDIDPFFLDGLHTASVERRAHDVFAEFQALLDSSNGYNNWYEFLRDTPQAIPTLQLGDISQINTQITKLVSLGNGLAVRFEDSTFSLMPTVLQALIDNDVRDLFVILDYGQLYGDVLVQATRAVTDIRNAHLARPSALLAVSASSFPSSFPETSNGDATIQERRLFREVDRLTPTIRKIYSDRASARAEKLSGGGIPSPRIDYPLKDVWRFIKKKLSDPKEENADERIELYTEVAQEIMDAEYWKNDLHVWGTQMIELTSRGEGAGIDNATKATAVRINLHMHQQIFYDDNDALLNTEEDWVD